jgi:hypothetical protein
MFVMLALAGPAEAALALGLLICFGWLSVMLICTIAGVAARSWPLVIAVLGMWLIGTLLFRPFMGFFPSGSTIDPDVVSWERDFFALGIAWALESIGLAALVTGAWWMGWFYRHNAPGFPVAMQTLASSEGNATHEN